MHDRESTDDRDVFGIRRSTGAEKVEKQPRHRNAHQETDVAGGAKTTHAEQAAVQTIEQREGGWEERRATDAQQEHRLDQRGQIISGERKEEEARGERDPSDRADSKVTESITHPTRGNRAKAHHQQHRPDQPTPNRGIETDRFGEEQPECPGQQTTGGPVGGGHEQERPQGCAGRGGRGHRRLRRLGGLGFDATKSMTPQERDDAGEETCGGTDQIDGSRRIAASVVRPGDLASEDRPTTERDAE